MRVSVNPRSAEESKRPLPRPFPRYFPKQVLGTNIVTKLSGGLRVSILHIVAKLFHQNQTDYKTALLGFVVFIFFLSF